MTHTRQGGGRGSEGGGGATDRGTYVELVYELLQDTWGNILQQTISPMRQACRTQQDADSCTVGQVHEIQMKRKILNQIEIKKK